MLRVEHGMSTFPQPLTEDTVKEVEFVKNDPFCRSVAQRGTELTLTALLSHSESNHSLSMDWPGVTSS